MAMKPPAEVRFHWAWRTGLALLGVSLLVLGLVLWWSPPSKVEFPPQASSAVEATNVPDRSAATTALLVGAGIALIAIAANGRRFTSLKLGEVEAAFSAASSAEAKARTLAKAAGLPPAQRQTAVAQAGARAYHEALLNPIELDTDQIAISAVESLRSQ